MSKRRAITAPQVPIIAVPGRATAVGLELPEGLGPAEWLDVGRAIVAAGGALMWWIGDWANYRAGDRRYDDEFRDHVEELGLNYKTVAQAKWVANRYADISLRREKLRWHHHKVAVAIGDDEVLGDLLARAEAEGWSVARTREEARALLGNPAATRLGAPPKPAEDPDDPGARLTMILWNARSLVEADPAELAAGVPTVSRERVAGEVEQLRAWLAALVEAMDRGRDAGDRDGRGDGAEGLEDDPIGVDVRSRRMA